MNRAYIWQQWLQELICDFTAAKCDDIIDRYQDHFSPPEPNQIQVVVGVEIKLQGLAADANSKLLKAMETLKQEQTERPHAEAQAQQYEAQINQYIQGMLSNPGNGRAGEGMLTLDCSQPWRH